MHLPTNDVVETPRKLHSRSHPSLEARAHQWEHVLGENRAQDQAGVREQSQCRHRLQHRQDTNRETQILATGSKHTPGRDTEPRAASLGSPCPGHFVWGHIFGTGGCQVNLFLCKRNTARIPCSMLAFTEIPELSAPIRPRERSQALLPDLQQNFPSCGRILP